jgi:hypothetical protein
MNCLTKVAHRLSYSVGGLCTEVNCITKVAHRLSYSVGGLCTEVNCITKVAHRLSYIGHCRLNGPYDMQVTFTTGFANC